MYIIELLNDAGEVYCKAGPFYSKEEAEQIFALLTGNKRMVVL